MCLSGRLSEQAANEQTQVNFVFSFVRSFARSLVRSFVSSFVRFHFDSVLLLLLCSLLAKEKKLKELLKDRKRHTDV